MMTVYGNSNNKAIYMLVYSVHCVQKQDMR